MTKKDNWFESWFDSPYYHILYGHRDDDEARVFINQLIGELKPQANSKFLDLACGKGRHSRVIRQHGFEVDGVDLSPNNISIAKKFEDERLHFEVHDMREVFKATHYDYVFNLFTSFGYFIEHEDHLKTLRAINVQLKRSGALVLDYVNCDKAEKQIGSGIDEEHQRGAITFYTRKWVDETHISKSIDFEVRGKQHHFKEHIWRLKLSDFEQLLKDANFRIKTIYGGYELQKFDKENSERLILIAEKL